MTAKTLAKRLKVIGHWPNIFLGKKNYILIVSHMRSRSSLLSHILGSHPDISGYAEMSQAYHGLKDFMNLRYEVWVLNNHILGGRYVLDKILHNRYGVTDSVLASPSVHICYLLRRPEDAIKSITQLAKLHPGAGIWENPEQAASYYEGRISQMVQYVRQSSQQSFFIESDDLIDNTESVLGAISNWLSLDEPLSSRYSLFERTGKPGFGDPSKAILAGKVVANKHRYEDIHLSPVLLERVRESYERARRTFQANCVHLKAPTQ